MEQKFNALEFITERNLEEERELSSGLLVAEAVEFWEMCTDSNEVLLKDAFEIYVDNINFRAFYRALSKEQRKAFSLSVFKSIKRVDVDDLSLLP